MSPEAKAAATVVALLRSEMRNDRAAMGRHARELRTLASRWNETAQAHPLVVVAAVSLHSWYTACEMALERIARAVDELVPSGPRSHAELLSQMTVEVPGLRPAVIPPGLTRELLELLKFRHFFRHAYNVELDPALIGREAQRLIRLEPEVERALDSFDAFLQASLDEVSKG